jgi:D-lactate dehydrogenase (cytochrome)
VIQSLILPFSADYEEYLRDESRSVGTAESISFPTTEAEVIDVIRQARTLGRTVTTQGARTGIVAGAVPQGGHILNLSKMKAIGEVYVDGDSGDAGITVQPGAILSDVREKVEGEGLFLPPDPTETTASIGGMIAANASGALTYLYGSTRHWVRSLRVVLADGDTLHLERGANRARGRSFSLTTESGRVTEGRLPSYNQPDVKSAAGYFVADDMDLIDLFIGMEGTLGVITQAELRLIPKPGAIHGLTVFLPSEEAAIKLVRVARGEAVEGSEPVAIRPAGIEFFSSEALDLLRRIKSDYSAFEKIPAMRPSWHTAVYIEFHAESDDAAEEAVMQVMEAATALGSSDEDTWYATIEREREPIKAFRHAVPEAVNLLIDERKRDWPGITKLGTDMSVPDEHLEAVLAMYREGLRENVLESVIFGHIGNNHVHVNILPASPEDYAKGKSLYLSWARRVVELGGSVSGEHGIGKLKVPFLELMYGPEGIAEMRELKHLFDPEMTLNPGDLFAAR